MGPLPVLMLHGWAITADFNFCHVMPHVAQRFGVVAMDLRGHGRGRPVARAERFSIGQCADDAARLIDALSIDQVVECGYSLGGPVGLEFARRHRDRVAGLVLQATALSFNSTGDRITRAALRALRPLAARSHGAGKSLPLHYFNRIHHANPETSAWWPWLRRGLVLCHPRVIIDAILDEFAFDFRSHLGAIAGLPTVVVVTARGRSVAPQDQRLMAKLLDATVIDIKAGHDVFFTHPTTYSDTTITAVDPLLHRT
jgi:pimeloyl-ACP methyl ester carboxylesterase